MVDASNSKDNPEVRGVAGKRTAVDDPDTMVFFVGEADHESERSIRVLLSIAEICLKEYAV